MPACFARTALVAMLALAGLLAAPLVSTRAEASSVFDELKTSIFGDRVLLDGHGVAAITVPYRPDDIRAVPFEVAARFSDGRTVKSVSFIVDNNPSPVAAVFRFGPGRDHVGLAIRFRLNQQSDVRAVVEASDGKLYMVSQLMKFPGGQAACSAPLQTPPDEIAANMGKMTLTSVVHDGTANASTLTPRVRYTLAHPNHTGMVLDQITLLYTPLNMVEHLTAQIGNDTVFEMEGSIALNENPVIEFDYPRNGATQMKMTARVTGGTEFTRTFDVGTGS